jgi:sigma-54 dependent transcriptional regulator, acetoin dehydrogenase operon transcriptional activator AcoR
MLTSLQSPPQQRLAQIAQARQSVLLEGRSLAAGPSAPWIERSWQRCLQSGKRPDHNITFDVVAPPAMRRTREANHLLAEAARPILEKLGTAIASTRYFAILTNADGVVVDFNGAIDRRDPRVDLITRIGVDLSEQSVGTTAIGAALTELQPVWLHRGEHFYDVNCAYSCAGAPLFGPDGKCVGMLDLTGVDTVERPELKHLVMQSARGIENELVRSKPHALMIRLAWSSHSLGEDSDGLVCVDNDGYVTGANMAARQMLSVLGDSAGRLMHCDDLFAVSGDMLFDSAKRSSGLHAPGIEVPLWSGLRVHALALASGPNGKSPARNERVPATDSALPLKDVETALIRQAVTDTKGNVMKAARMLGISRATVYRRLGHGKPK